MQTLSSAVSLCALISLSTTFGVVAQSALTSPRGFLTEPSHDKTTYLGTHNVMRTMLLDGEVRGTAMQVKSVAFRPRHAFTLGVRSRAWKSVTIDMSDCDLAKASSTFSTNSLSTPTRVFSGNVLWTGWTGTPSTNAPAPWASKGLGFPFKQSWNSSGKRDLCLDFAFTGGNMVSSSPFDLDAYSTLVRYGDSISLSASPGCKDSSASKPATITASWKSVAFLYEVKIATRYTGYGRNVVQAIGFGGSTTGSALPGVTCNRLYPSLALPIILMTTAGRGDAETRTRLRAVFDNTIVGANIWIQAGWDDPKIGSLLLTPAIRLTGPGLATNPRRLAVWNTASATAVKGVAPSKDVKANPLMRYTR